MIILKYKGDPAKHAVFYFDIFIFENKVSRKKMQLDRQFALFPAAVECPDVYV